MLKRTITALLAVSITFGIIAFAESDSGNIPFDFAKENYGFVSIFADYPAGDTVDEFYELAHSWENIPSPAIFCIFQLLHAYSTGFRHQIQHIQTMYMFLHQKISNNCARHKYISYPYLLPKFIMTPFIFFLFCLHTTSF